MIPRHFRNILTGVTTGQGKKKRKDLTAFRMKLDPSVKRIT